MTTSRSFPGPKVSANIANGLAMIVVMMGGSLAGRVLWEKGDVQDQGVASCIKPVEVVEEEGERLGCASDATLRVCGHRLKPGDRLDLRQCQHLPGGMKPSTRLALDLPMLLNRASIRDLQLLKGIGPSLSAAIVAERQMRGRFNSVDDLIDVKGIGEKRLQKFRPYLQVAESVSDPASGDTLLESSRQDDYGLRHE
jgi:competence ComEA-like helix-hairpin-helix protein